MIALATGGSCAIIDGIGADVTGQRAEPLEPCSAHRDCYGYCSTDGCLSFQDITFYTSYLPCDGNVGECNRQRYPEDNGLTCPSLRECTCVNNTCLASTGVGCDSNADCGKYEFCNITDKTCTYTFNCFIHDDCYHGVCSTSGCNYAATHQRSCTSASVCGTNGLCIGTYCWKLTGVGCLKDSDCGDGGVCSRPDGEVCLYEVF